MENNINNEVWENFNKQHYIKCVFLNDTEDEFNKMCNKIEVFSDDMVCFLSTNNKYQFTLAIIPKCQILKIINVYDEELYNNFIKIK